MKTPDEWRTFLARFWQGSLQYAYEQGGDAKTWITKGLKGLSKDENRAVADFLDTLLALDLSPEEMARVWNENCQEYYIGPGEVGKPDVLFTFIRDKAREMSGGT